MIDTVYVFLADEAVDVWRPVLSQHVSGDIYILGEVEGVAVPDDEGWEFPPGTRVKVATRVFSDGQPHLVAIARA
jgi:hypothetical protein